MKILTQKAGCLDSGGADLDHEGRREPVPNRAYNLSLSAWACHSVMQLRRTLSFPKPYRPALLCLIMKVRKKFMQSV